MMQDCPKCGFTQPKDRYCANCGLDIEAFKPKSSPILVRLFKNTGVQISLVLGVIAAMGFIIYFSQQKTLSELTSQIRQVTPDTTVAADTALAVDTEPPVEETGKSDITTAATLTDLQTETVTPTKIQIHFVELTKPYVQKITSENQVLSQSSHTRVLLAKSKDPYAVYNDTNNVEKLPGQKEISLKIGQTITFDFNYPSTDGNDEIGFTLNLLPTQVSLESVEIDMSAVIILKNTQASAFTTTESNATFNFAPTYGIIVLGVVPTEKSFEPDIELLSNSPLSILSSPQFKENQSEFGIYLSVK
jgi:hypothetical protein